jgi:octopine/nopaline transport system permease protein
VFLCAAVIYLVLNFVVVRLMGLLEHRLSPHLRAAPHPLDPPSGLAGMANLKPGDAP